MSADLPASPGSLYRACGIERRRDGPQAQRVDYGAICATQGSAGTLNSEMNFPLGEAVTAALVSFRVCLVGCTSGTDPSTRGPWLWRLGHRDGEEACGEFWDGIPIWPRRSGGWRADLAAR